jgi:transposase-like protein
LPCCPECGSRKVWKAGLRWTSSGQIQRYLCRECGYRFSENNEFSRKITNSSYNKEVSRQICVSESEMKNLVKVAQHQKQDAGATQTNAEVKGKLVEYSFWMHKQGYKNSTIKTRTKILKQLTKRGANLDDPESVKKVIAEQPTWNEGTKSFAVVAYSSYLNKEGKLWNPPRYRRTKKNPLHTNHTGTRPANLILWKKIKHIPSMLQRNWCRPRRTHTHGMDRCKQRELHNNHKSSS